MALTSPDNIWTPDPGDLYHPTVSLGGMADSIQDAITSLRGDNALTVKVANVSERAAALANHGTPTTSNPLIVFRANAGPGRELEYTTDGSKWYTLAAEEDTGWVGLDLHSDVVTYQNDPNYTVKARRVGGVVTIRGGVSPSSTDAASRLTGTGGSMTIAELPEVFQGPPRGAVLSQGSGSNTWVLRLDSLRLYGYRYGPGNASTSSWLPFIITYVAEN